VTADVTGKTVLVTGSTDGLGRALAFELAATGATVLLHGRDRSDRAPARSRPG
jgi:NAD(P)-dependent dehydrogenase (short-subunit alcohol dehydrogenase family)